MSEGEGGKPMNVRVSAKAVIVREGRLLVTRNVDHEGIFYLLPGGGQEAGESLPAAVQRECREEIGVEVEVHDLLLVRDYIGRHHEFAEVDQKVHQVELMFRCTLPPDQVPRLGAAPDSRQATVWRQTGIEWLPLERLGEYRLYPRTLAQALPARLASPATGHIYLGDVL